MAGEERDQGWTWGEPPGERSGTPSEPPAAEQSQYGQYGQYAPRGTPPQSGQQAGPPQYGQYAPQAPQGQPPQSGQQAGPPQYGQYAPQAPQGQPPQSGQQAGPPQYGQYAPQGQAPQGQAPQYGQQPQAPQYGQYGHAPQQGQYGGPTTWGGPGGAQYLTASQPGIVPLRPLNLGEVLDGAFRAIRANPKVMFGLSLIVMSIVAVVEAIFLWFVLDSTNELLTGQMTDEALAAFGASSLATALLVSVASTFATIILTGLLILSVSQSVLGRVVSLSGLWQQARGQIWRLVGQTVIVGLLAVGAVLLGLFLSMMMLGFMIAGAGDGAGAWLIIPMLLVFLAGLVAGAWLGVRLSLAPPALMLERAKVTVSLRRSWALTQGHFWRILGILAVSIIIVVAASTALQVPIGIITGLVFQGSETLSLTPLLITNVLSVLISALTVPFYAAVLALVYVDVRMRKEGLDVELARAAEAG